MKAAGVKIRNLKTPELVKQLRLSILKTEIDEYRGIWYTDERLDFHEILDEWVRRNALSVPIICTKDKLLEIDSRNFTLKIKPFGQAYNLCEKERFFHQPAAAGLICSGALIAEDVVVTAAHFVDRNVKNLRFAFGYVMASPSTAVIQLPREQIYHGVEILHWEYDVDKPDSNCSDWTFVKLDRKVADREIINISKEPVFYEQPVYVIGYPCGLPLKYAPGAAIQKVEKSYFMAPLDVFSGNSGSPVFSAETHELLGIVAQAQGNWEDFQWTKDGVVSMIYPNDEINSNGARCIKVSEFNEYITRR
jgi:V8-like Glu-specific endopeptidase